MINRIINENMRYSYLSSFIDGYFLPYTVQARLVAQEPLLEYAPSESDYVRSAWQDAINALNAAMVQYAKEI